MQKPKLGKIKLLSAKEQVAAVLRKAILSRELVEGQEITLEGIAGMVGVSSMPVREAFQILAADGLIKVRPNKGAVVLGINEQTIREHYEIRALLESEAVAKASRPRHRYLADSRCIMPLKRLSRKITRRNTPT